MAAVKRGIPLWVSNILVFGLLIGVVVVYFFWQIQQTRKAFLHDADTNAQLVAGVIQLNATGALYAREVTEEILQTFMINTARFVDYLESVEPFVTGELTAFAGEMRLAGIRISRDAGGFVEGPSRWTAGMQFGCEDVPRLTHWKQKHLYLLSWPAKQSAACVVIGVAAENVESLQARLGLKQLTKALAALPGIRYVRIEDIKTGSHSSSPEADVVIREKDTPPVAEARLPMDEGVLIVGLDAQRLLLSLNRLWRDFFIFSTALALFGALLSFVLYRRQSFHLAQVRAFEQQLAQEREDAALGRAAGSIAHEVRNPLNALAMGLQRLQIEGTEILPERRQLVGLMLDAVRRTNTIVTKLLHYTHLYTPRQESVQLDRIVGNVLNLYRDACAEGTIQVTENLRCREPVAGDADLLAQVVENLVKNAIEAQPAGGFLDVEIVKKETAVALVLRNGGFPLPPDQAQRIFEPYFTTKAEGTGLGISIARRIVKEHRGSMDVRCLDTDTVEISVSLPLSFSSEETKRTQPRI